MDWGNSSFSLIKYTIHDRDSTFSKIVRETLKSLGIESVRTSYQSRWQNGTAERWVGSWKRELMEHVIILNQRHAYVLLIEYIQYYNEDRTHYSLEKDPPFGRAIIHRPSDDARVIALPRIGGLHHKYTWTNVA